MTTSTTDTTRYAFLKQQPVKMLIGGQEDRAGQRGQLEEDHVRAWRQIAQYHLSRCRFEIRCAWRDECHLLQFGAGLHRGWSPLRPVVDLRSGNERPDRLRQQD